MKDLLVASDDQTLVEVIKSLKSYKIHCAPNDESLLDWINQYNSQCWMLVDLSTPFLKHDQMMQLLQMRATVVVLAAYDEQKIDMYLQAGARDCLIKPLHQELLLRRLQSSPNDYFITYLSFLVHELKNPLASVKGYTDLLLQMDEQVTPEQQADFLTVIRRNATTALNLVGDIRDAFRVELGFLQVHRDVIALDEVIFSAAHAIKSQLGAKSQTLVLNVPERFPFVIGDSIRLNQAVGHLLSNAVKFSPPETKITIMMQVDGADAYVTINDEGIGMSPDEIQRATSEMFYRSDRAEVIEQHGHGLGLIIAKGIIDAHDGRFWIESELGRGTIIHFTIPFAKDEIHA